LSTVGYAAAVWYSFRSDNFHDFFTEYVPGSREVIHAIQDYQYRQRYPGSSTVHAGERHSDLGKKGPHISAVSANLPEVREKKKEEEKKEKEEVGKGKGKDEKEQKGPTIELVPPTSTPAQSSDQAKQEVQKEPPAKRDQAGKASQADTQAANTKTTQDGPKEGKKAQPKPPIPKESTSGAAQKADAAPPTKPEKVKEPAPPPPSQPSAPARLEIAMLDISPNDEGLEKLQIAINDLIRLFNSTPTYDDKSAPLYEFLKKAVDDLNSRLPQIISTTRAEADAQVKAQAAYFNQLHQDLNAALIQERDLMVNEWTEALDRERDELQNRYDQRLSEELKKQGEVNDKRVQNELLEQAIALRRQWLRELQTQVETERAGRLSKLASLEKALGELTGLQHDSHGIFSKAEKAKKTAVAVQALKDAALNRGEDFVAELAALKSISGNDELVRAVIASIDPDAYKGVVSQAELASHFQKLSGELQKIALLPEDAGVAGHAVSWLLSHIMFRQRGYIKGDDMPSRLARVEALLESGELDEATREVNSFSGWGRELSRDWLKLARRRLEVVQAIDVNSFEMPLILRSSKRRQHWTP
jgi:MICOS complex subunit MIC60